MAGGVNAMDLDEVRRNWELMGAQNPMWAILTARTHWDREAFFETGRQQVGQILAHLTSISAPVLFGRALDFGCGIGRLTQALCEHFQECDGVDIAEAMIAQACAVNRFGDRCRYHRNSRNDLGLFPDESFDFVLSLIVLQHMQPRYSSRYIVEFLRVLRMGGVAYFQIPSGVASARSALPATESSAAAATIPITISPVQAPQPETPATAVSQVPSVARDGRELNTGGTEGRVEMAGIPRPLVIELLQRIGGEVLACARDDMAGPVFESYTYVVRKVALPKP